MASAAYVDATDLVSWANRRDAQERLPQLVRRLILTTARGISSIHFPAGEGVQSGGWDGVAVAADGNAFVPEGLSVWETGTSTDPKQKAEGDYAKRLADPLGVNPADATFVFVTPRRWPSKSKWEEEKASAGIWRAVRAYDADDLETWLELSPAVHVWISAHLGKGSSTVQDLDSFWIEWAGATQPRLSGDLVIAGRKAEVEQLTGRLTGHARTSALLADSEEEALAFLAAVAERLPESDRDTLFARGLVIRDPDTWRRFVVSETPLLLAPLFAGADIAGAVRAGHHVFIPLGRDTAKGSETIELPRPRRAAAKDALLKMGLVERRADAVATLARRGLLSLRRTLAVSSELQQPRWARPDEALALLPALLAGTWDDSLIGDREVLASLAVRPYEDFSRTLTRWQNEDDPPVRRVGTNWVLVSKEDAWRLLARFLTVDDLHRLHEAVVTVLAAPDPALDLPTKDRWMAGALGHARPHSGLLREGLADTLAVMGALGGDTQLPGRRNNGQAFADRVVYGLLDRANADQTGRAWSSLAATLPLLAEAAPDTFLQAVDVGLTGDRPILRELFTDAVNVGTFAPSSPHTHLLWALEGLAWAPDHLGAAALRLARLARLDPGGRLANRPSASLRAIFLVWHPASTASLEQRLHVIDALRAQEPVVAWQLLVALLPGHHDEARPTHTPRWRAWRPDGEFAVTVAEWQRAVEGIISRLLEDVDANGDRWADLVQAVGRLPERARDARDSMIDRLLATEPDTLSEPGRDAVWRALRGVISRHRRHSGAGWAMPSDQINRLAEAYQRFEPADPIRRYAWLFAPRPALPGADDTDWQSYRRSHARSLEMAQDSAARAAYEAGGMATVLNLAAAAEQPGQIGVAAGRWALPDAEEPVMLSMLAAPEAANAQLAAGYVTGRFQVNGWDWAEATLHSTSQAWSPEQRAMFLTCLPRSSRTWDWAERFDQHTEESFWRLFAVFGIEEPQHCGRAAAKLLEHGRPYAALSLMGLYADEESATVPPPLVVEVLERAAATLPSGDVDRSMLGYDVARLLDCLEQSGMVEEQQIARLEWAYLLLLEDDERGPRTLHRELARDPAFFANVVAMVFPAEDEERAETTNEELVRVQLGSQLLDSWHQVPGAQDDGSIDPQSLAAWVDQARLSLADRGRAKIGDRRIGHVLRYSPIDEDGGWPSRPVRDLIERIASTDLERGIEVEVRNSRGVTSRSLTAGGTQERELVEQYLSYTQVSGNRWPRAAAMLRRIADTFTDEALRHDEDAALREDLWR